MDYGYARVSTTDQNTGLQLDALARAGCDHIVEEHVSGVSKKRPVRDQILAQAKRGDRITVWSLDRWGRSTSEVLGILKDLDERGIAFRCLTQPVDTSTSMGKMFIGFLAVLAEFERSLLIERVKAGKARQRAEGKPMGRLVFGWSTAEEIDQDQAQLLREARDRILNQDQNLSQVVDDWNARGLYPGKATRWRVTHLRRILLNPWTAGIIGDQDQERLRRLFDRPHRAGRPAEHLLSGILTCARCGQPMYGAQKLGKTQVQQMVYRCHRGSGSGGRHDGCGKMSIVQARADAWSMEMFIAAVIGPDFAQALNRRQAELLDQGDAEELDEWRAELDDLDLVQGTRFYNEEMRRRHVQLRGMVEKATAQLMIQPDLQAMADLPRSEELLRAAWESWTISARRTWIRRLVHRIEVHPPATRRGPATDVESRLVPIWKM
jgi:DNA invertase Pin-like site-specific DNA recombinase